MVTATGTAIATTRTTPTIVAKRPNFNFLVRVHRFDFLRLNCYKSHDSLTMVKAKICRLYPLEKSSLQRNSLKSIGGSSQGLMPSVFSFIFTVLVQFCVE